LDVCTYINTLNIKWIQSVFFFFLEGPVHTIFECPANIFLR